MIIFDKASDLIIRMCIESVKNQTYDESLRYHLVIEDGCVGIKGEDPMCIIDHQTGGPPWGRHYLMTKKRRS